MRIDDLEEDLHLSRCITEELRRNRESTEAAPHEFWEAAERLFMDVFH